MSINKMKTGEIAQTIESETSKSIDATVASLKQNVAKATAGFEATQGKMKEGVEKAMKTAEDLVAFSQGNMEAMVQSSQIWATGVQDLSKNLAAAAQASMDQSMSAFKALTGVRSLKDAFELQASFARGALEKSLAESGKLTEASFKLTEQAMAPITARVTVAVEKFARWANRIDGRSGMSQATSASRALT
jgi:phasin family protein